MNQFEDLYCIAVADYIKKYLLENNIDAADLAAAANVDRKQVYRLINKENIPKLSTFVKITLAAGLEPKFSNMEFDFDDYRMKNNILIAFPKEKY